MILGIEVFKRDVMEIFIKVLKCILGCSLMFFCIYKSRKFCGDLYIVECVFFILNLLWSDFFLLDLIEIYYNLVESYFDDISKYFNFVMCCKI